MSTEADTIVETKLKVPSLYRIVFLNDDFTPMDFVVELLLDIYDKSLGEAQTLMMQIHQTGKGVAGVYTREIAEQKVEETMTIAIHYGHPLRVICEPN